MARLTVRMAATLAFAALLSASPAARAGDGWWGRLDEGEAVSLVDLMAAPQSYRGRTLTFFCIFHSRENYFDPVRTPFNPKRHDNISVWPDGAPIWEERAFQHDLPFVYIPRTHPQRDALLQLEMVTRIEITGKVRTVLRGRPFIEVFGFQPTGHRVSRQVVRAVNAGDNFARLGTADGDQLAARKYRDALEPDLPPVYDLIVRKRLAEALRRLGNEEQAGMVERGEILGGGSMPQPDPSTPLPSSPFDDAPSPFDDPPSPFSDTSPPPAPFDDLPPGGAAPVLPPAALPGRPGASDAGSSPPWPEPSAPQPFTQDLPGQPAGPVTRDDDLPGMRVGAAPRAPTFPPRTAPPPAAPSRAGPGSVPAGLGAPARGDFPPGVLPPPALPAPGTQPARPMPGPALRAAPPAPSRTTLGGVPPKRRPRLTGVK